METANKYHISSKGFLTGIRAVYDAINQESFSGKLPKISIQICKLEDTMTAYQTAAAFVIRKETQSFWIENHRHSYGVEYLSIVFDNRLMYFTDGGKFTDEIIDCLFHEMIHEYCYLNGIADCNDEMQYHNSYFMEVAENHGLFCWAYDEEYGFNHTVIPDDLFNRIIQRVSPDIWEIMKDNIAKVKERLCNDRHKSQTAA